MSRKGVILVTGAGGFTGLHVRRRAKELGYQCIGLAHSADEFPPDEGSTVVQVDLLDRSEVFRVVSGLDHIEYVLHLAAVSFVASDDIPSMYSTNIIGTLNLIDALSARSQRPKKVLIASSANVYGEARSLPITEDTPINPVNDYGVSKVSMEAMLAIKSNIPLVIARPFNYTGRGQNERFLIPKIVQAFREGRDELELGNLDVARDFSDVRDLVRAYLLLLEHPGALGVFNICSGSPTTLGAIVDAMNNISGHSLEIRVNPKFVRENEIKVIYGTPEKLENVIGDFRAYSIDDTLQWMYTSEQN